MSVIEPNIDPIYYIWLNVDEVVASQLIFVAISVE